MGFGKKTIEIFTENPLQVEAEKRERAKENNKEIIRIIADTAIQILKVVIKK